VGFDYTDECGEDIANDMTDGDTVVSSWSTAARDWVGRQHPIVLSAERESTWNGGNFDWPNTTHRDHFWATV